jgi:glyoxylase-like metal-dependent hydrolase (beta-lactamase superfamily II)
MYELVKVSDRVYYIDMPSKVGIVLLGGTDAALIDSGNNKEAGRKILKILNANGWTLKSIFNTHFHADHIGGNSYLQKQTGCKIYVPDTELSFVRHPILEPAYLFGGNPPAELRHKFMMAAESVAEPLSDDVLPEGMEIIPLPGHSFEMVGFKIDGAAFIADCLASEATLDKYKLVFLGDVGQYLKTLETVKEMREELFIPSHAQPTSDISQLVQKNIDATMQICEVVLEICEHRICFEDILKKIFDRYGLVMNFEQYALIGSTVKCYLTYLKETERLTAEVADNKIVYKA